MKHHLTALAIATSLIAPFAAAETTASGAPCTISDFSVYFAPNETELSAAAERAVAAEVTELASCSIAIVEANAVSTDSDAPSGNQTLAAARLQTVLQALKADGVSPASGAPKTSIAETGEHELLARRVDVRITPVAVLNS